VDTPYSLRCKDHRLVSILGGEAGVAIAKAEDTPHTIGVCQRQHDGTDDVVKAWTKATAGNDAARDVFRSEEDLRSRSRKLERWWHMAPFQVWLELGSMSIGKHAIGIVDEALAVFLQR
jgi:hypothetical protein